MKTGLEIIGKNMEIINFFHCPKPLEKISGKNTPLKGGNIYFHLYFSHAGFQPGGKN